MISTQQVNCLIMGIVVICKERFQLKKNIEKYGIFHTGGLPDFHNFFREKNVFFQENCKDDQNDLIHPEK